MFLECFAFFQHSIFAFLETVHSGSGAAMQTFEHRTALFSLALADCVIVNMWYHVSTKFTIDDVCLRLFVAPICVSDCSDCSWVECQFVSQTVISRSPLERNSVYGRVCT